MKIILCGKGGCGKSTVASLLSYEFAQRGKKVLVVDTDESNYGLHRQLGLPLPADFLEYFGGKKAFGNKGFNNSFSLNSACRKTFTANNGFTIPCKKTITI